MRRTVYGCLQGALIKSQDMSELWRSEQNGGGDLSTPPPSPYPKPGVHMVCITLWAHQRQIMKSAPQSPSLTHHYHGSLLWSRSRTEIHSALLNKAAHGAQQRDQTRLLQIFIRQSGYTNTQVYSNTFIYSIKKNLLDRLEYLCRGQIKCIFKIPLTQTHSLKTWGSQIQNWTLSVQHCY